MCGYFQTFCQLATLVVYRFNSQTFTIKDLHLKKQNTDHCVFCNTKHQSVFREFNTSWYIFKESYMNRSLWNVFLTSGKVFIVVKLKGSLPLNC